MTARLGVVYSAFRPDETLAVAVAAAAAQVDGPVVVVDDGSGPGFDTVWDALRASGVRVVTSPENQGIAAALNHGLRLCLDESVDGVITFDQDSTVDDGFVVTLVAALDDARAKGVEVGLVVPERFAGVSQVHGRLADGTLLARHAIQSGALLPASALARVGLLREDLFIDLVDTEYELRCHVAGLHSIIAPGTTLGHSLGQQYRRTLFGRDVRLPGIPPVVTLSTPFRYYYRVRNRRIVNRAYARRALGWVTRDSLLEGIHFANALVLARPRRSLWRLYRAGWKDARRGRMGRMPEELSVLARGITWNAPPTD